MQEDNKSQFGIEDLADKSQLIKEYYSWLLDSKDISLESELDVCLAISHRDPFIYYPTCLDDLLHTECLHKLGRISQLSTVFQSNPGAWHSRLDHSIATFGKKQEEHLYLWMHNPDFVKYVEENGLKKFILAEEIKMLYHDVGHFPFSHVTEKQIIRKKGIHEKVGEDILLTNPEVVAILVRLGLYDAMRTVLTEDILNSHEHDEGNEDVDRKAYLETDIAHLGGIENPTRYPIYSRKIAKINPDGSYARNPDGSIILTDSLTPESKYIDIYDFSDISEVENFLYTRETLYKKTFYHPTTLAHDTILGLVQTEIAPKNPEHCHDLITYINLLQSGDFKSAKEYDEVDIFKSLISLGLNSDNPDVIDMVSLLFVPFTNWLNLMNAQLDKTKDSDFIRFINKNLIHGTSRFAQNLRTKDFFEKNVIIAEEENSNLPRSAEAPHLIYNSHSFSAYNSSCPLYVEDSEGRVFPLENHPNRSRDWQNSRSSLDVVICVLPLLKLQEVPSSTIDSYVTRCNELKSDAIGKPPISEKVFSYFENNSEGFEH